MSDAILGLAPTEEPGIAAPAAGRSKSGRRWPQRLRCPPGQPWWVRPTLLVLLTLAALTYTWGIENFALEPFYGAAARSMSISWHNFIFGAFDPFGTISVDKLPGALWLQALSLRLFGFHLWAIALPQAIEGVLSVWVLYRALRRIAGPITGLVGAALLVAAPATALLNRGNISDSLLILLSTLALDSVLAAIVSERPRRLLLAGLWLGLAFQTKMVQAWLLFPGLLVAYLLAARGTLGARWRAVIAAGVVMVVVSLSWMTAVSLVPNHDRPYVDGTTNNSLFTQVFVYNGTTRLGIKAGSSNVARVVEPYGRSLSGHTLNGATSRIPAGWGRLFQGPFGRDVGWLLPLSLGCLVLLLVQTRGRPRGDPIRAATLLWGTELVVLVTFFSSGKYLNSYYTAALSPMIAVLVALGMRERWLTKSNSWAWRAGGGLAMAGTVALACALVPESAGLRPVLVGVVLILGVIAALALLLQRGDPGRSRRRGLVIAAVVLAVGFVPAATVADVTVAALGPFATPYQSPATNYQTQGIPEQFQALNTPFERLVDIFPEDDLVGVFYTSGLAAGDIMMTGHEFLPIGGFSGGAPEPTLGRIEQLARRGISLALVPLNASSDPRVGWIIHHCSKIYRAQHEGGATFQNYRCVPESHRAKGSLPVANSSVASSQ
jgi:4-amino-4-deoxy-L-arabinose transferase-like glycosyltransferase